MVLDATVYRSPTHRHLRERVIVDSRSGAMDYCDPGDDRIGQGKTRGMARTPRKFRKCEIVAAANREGNGILF
jgi:hypothetical protein